MQYVFTGLGETKMSRFNDAGVNGADWRLKKTFAAGARNREGFAFGRYRRSRIFTQRKDAARMMQYQRSQVRMTSRGQAE